MPPRHLYDTFFRIIRKTVSLILVSMFVYVSSGDCYGINLYLRDSHTSVSVELFLYINKDMLRRIHICKKESLSINAYKYMHIHAYIHIHNEKSTDGHTHELI
jgi:hypothetical protein